MTRITLAWPRPTLFRLASRQPHWGRIIPVPLWQQQSSSGAGNPSQLREPLSDPYQEFQRFKTHPVIAPTFEGGKRIAYGARAISEGGWQSIPKLVFPGGALLACAVVFQRTCPASRAATTRYSPASPPLKLCLRQSRKGAAPIRSMLMRKRCGPAPSLSYPRPVRNAKPLWSRFGTAIGIPLGGADMWLNTIVPGVGLGLTLRHRKTDAASLKPAKYYKPAEYPKPDGLLTFDRLTSVAFSGTNHQEDQPVHLRLADPAVPINVSFPARMGRACAALLPRRCL